MVQEIIDLTIKEGIKFPIKEKDWMRTFGVYWLITIIPSFLLIPIIILLVIPVLNIVAIFLLLLFSPILFLLGIYLQGYILEIMKNVKEGKEKPLPEHSDFASKMKLGFIKFILEFIPSIIAMLLIFLSIATIIAGTLLLSQEIFVPGVILLLLGLTLFMLFFLTFFLIFIFVIPSMIYIYLETEKLSQAYRWQNIKAVIQDAWQPFLILFCISAVGSMIISTIGQIPCIGLIVTIVGFSYISFVIAFVTGNIFKKLKTKII